MRVLLVGPDLESNLSLRYLSSSLLAAGHQPTIATFDCAADAEGVVRAAKGFELIGLSMCFQLRAPEFLALAAQLKAQEPTRPVIAGGHFASCAAAELLTDAPQLDVIVVHEGEQAIVELANFGQRLVERAHELRGVAVRKGGRALLTPARGIREDLDSVPLPDRRGPARLVAGVPTAYLMGSRGCVNACDYCCITTLHRMAPGKRFRQRSPENVVGEMAALYHQQGVRQFVFHDDNFLVPAQAHNHARVEAMATAMARQNLKDLALVLKCAPRDAERNILSRLKELGLIRIFMGIESGTQTGLDAIGRKQTVADAEKALSLCEELDVSSQYTLITFHPEATAESMLEDLAFARRHPQHPLNYCRAEVYAGTPLEKRLVEQGRAIGDYMGRVYQYTDPRVERVWELGSELFAGRCWGKDELLGQAIRLDHQVTVVRHFYEGAAVRRLSREFREFQVDLNLGTAALFAELVQLCADAPADAGALERARADLERRERQSREVLLQRLCDFRADIQRCTRVAFPESMRPAAPRPIKRMRQVVARHAAAVAVALGLSTSPVGGQTQVPAPRATADAGKKERDTAGQAKEPTATRHREDLGVAEKAPAPAPKPRDAGVRSAVPTPFVQDHGVAEAAPPPYLMDEGVAEAPPPPHPTPVLKPKPPPKPMDAGATQVVPQTYRNDHGVAEAAPPPFDRYRNDVGVAEAAPPPWDRVKPPPPPPPTAATGWSHLAVEGSGLTVYLSGTGAVSGAVALKDPQAKELTFTVNGSSQELLFKVTIKRVTIEDTVVLRVDSEQQVKVQIDGAAWANAPMKSTPRKAGQRTIVVEEPESHVRFKVVVNVSP